MTIRTRLAKTAHSRNLPWCVRVPVTIKAVDMLLTMLRAMACRTNRHQIVIIVFTRVVCMKNLMTFLTGKAMFATGILQARKLPFMTLTTFYRLQGGRCYCIEACINLRQFALSCRNKPWLEKPSQVSDSNNSENTK